MAKYESELYDEDYFNHDHDYGHNDESPVDDEPPIFNEGANDELTEDMSIYYEKVFEQNEGDSFVNKIKDALNIIKENIKQFPSKLWANIKTLPSRVIFGDRKGFGYKIAKDELERDKIKKEIKSKGKSTDEKKQPKDITEKAKVNSKEQQEKNNDEKISKFIPEMSTFMNNKIHNKEYISEKDIDTLDELFMKDLKSGISSDILKIELQTKNLNTIDYKLQNAVKLADSKTLEEMTDIEKRLVQSISTLSNRYYEIKQNIAFDLASLNEKINNYNEIIDKLNEFDSDKLPIECTGTFATGDRRVINFDFPTIADKDIMIDNDTLINFKDYLYQVELNDEVKDYLNDTNLIQNISIKNIVENEKDEVKPSEELASFVKDELNEKEDLLDNIDNEQKEQDEDYEYISVDDAMNERDDSDEVVSITPETYEDFER